MRMLVVFEKGELLRHIGHLDLMRAMQRILRRTGLPVAYSQGFNPHMLVNFASPLSVGTSGRREIMDVALTGEVSEEVFLSKLKEALPAALTAVMGRRVADTYPSPMSRLHAASYEIMIEDTAGESFMQAIPGFLERNEIPAMRKTKSGEKPCDIRPMIYNLAAKKTNDGIVFSAMLALREEATCKPDLLLTSLSQYCGVVCPPFTLVRTGLFGQGPQGKPVPLEGM